MNFTFPIPTPGGDFTVTVGTGTTVVFVGANGTGKTRLAVYIEAAMELKAHRIAAQRALILNPEVPKISEALARKGLETGFANTAAQFMHRGGHRWTGTQAATSLLNDFDFLLQMLFAEQANTALKTHMAVRGGTLQKAEATKFETLKEVWERLLPNRQLVLTADSIEVRASDGKQYSASAMSDGERSVFYMLGQALVLARDSLLIVDEPELHVHPSIMARLWDEIQATRTDCVFVFITHDLSFAASRIGQKFVIRDYMPVPQWTIEAVPEDTGFDEGLVTLILGSRCPILFVEGTETSIDAAMYRACFSEWTVIPRGSCEEVIHSVVTMRRNASMTRVTCGGLVDADDYTRDERDFLVRQGIEVLPVSEIENLIFLPDVSRAIAASEGYRFRTGSTVKVFLISNEPQPHP